MSATSSDSSCPKGFSLDYLGWSTFFRDALIALKDSTLIPARVAIENKHNFLLLSERGEALGEVPGRFLHSAESVTHLPKVGDWVACLWPEAEGRAQIHSVLPRKSQFKRLTGGKRKEEQVIAANVDVLFIVQGLDRDYNLRRLERYIVLAFESGAKPVVILNKSDLCPNPEEKRAEVEALPFDAPVCVTCAKSGEGIDALWAFIRPGLTIAVLGSSGVGKSKIINSLVGDSVQEIGEELGIDEKGKHTTVRRELVFLKGSGLLIDTPGMREIQLPESGVGLEQVFPEIEELSLLCRFGNCGHRSEPGCAVKSAVEAGTVQQVRLESYRKLKDEKIARETGPNKWVELRKKEDAKKKERLKGQVGRHGFGEI